jgi:hypothetical protein
MVSQKVWNPIKASFRRSRLCHNWQDDAAQRLRHSGLDPESSVFFKDLRFWMPDQVRHDEFGLFTISSMFGILNFGHCDLFDNCVL